MKKIALLIAISLFAGFASAQSVVINEFVANHTGADTDEFVELFSSPNTSLQGLTVLHIEGDGTSAGVIDSFYNAGTTDAGGFWTTGFLANGLENGTITLLLVSGFTAGAGTDTDTNNDGVQDVTPWSAILDSVGVWDGGATDWSYTSSRLDPTFDGGAFTVGGASRIPNGLDTNSVGDWRRNDFDGDGLPTFGNTGTTFWPEAFNTPGAVNNAPVPEPASLAALALGAMALLRRGKR